MVLTNSASSSRNMVQTNNQPQAADFGSIFSSVAVTAYGARNRRQRGVYNIDFWSANRPKTTAGPNTGRSVSGTRGSAWNVRGTSAHSRLIDDVTFSVQGLARATAAEAAADNAVTAKDSDRTDSDANPLGKIAINNINNAIKMLTDNDDTSLGLLNKTNISGAASTANKSNELNAIITNLNNLKLNVSDYSLIDYTNSSVSPVSIYNIRDNNIHLQHQYIQVKSFVDSLINNFNTSSFPDTEFETANTTTNEAFTAEMAYKAAYDNEIATNNAKAAAEATLATANSRLY